MGLSNELISQFAKLTKSDKQESKETTVKGTVVVSDDVTYVRLDGSDRLTPISTTADVKNDERVNVLIKDHSATITGNLSSPAARTDDVQEIGSKISEFEIVIADKVSVKEFDAQTGRIDDLVTENVTVKERLTATEADIGTLTAKDVEIEGKLTANEAAIDDLEAKTLTADVINGTFATIESLDATNVDIYNLRSTYGDFVVLTTERFEAVNGDIDNLDTNKLSATDAAIQYAKIDFANIGKAAIEALFSKSGIIDNLVVGDDLHVTGKLVGVTIVGDLIEGGTVKADKLVVQGEDGLYYKLNVTGETVEAEQTEYNSLDGSVITAHSITATKINVDDLVAFEATIGGINIADAAMYSKVKEDVNNTTPGFYVDGEGQLALGDLTNFLKYYKDEDGNYHLSIAADDIRFAFSGGLISEAVDAAQATANDASGNAAAASESIENVRDNMLVATVDGDGVIQTIQNGAGQVFDVSKTQADVRAAQTDINTAKSDISAINTSIDDVKKNINDITKKTDYINIGTIKVLDENGDPVLDDDGNPVTNPCIELYEVENTFKLRLTNKNVLIMNGETSPTDIDSYGLNSDNVTVRNEFRQTNEKAPGYFYWGVRSNGNYGLQWKEETH